MSPGDPAAAREAPARVSAAGTRVTTVPGAMADEPSPDDATEDEPMHDAEVVDAPAGGADVVDELPDDLDAAG